MLLLRTLFPDIAPYQNLGIIVMVVVLVVVLACWMISRAKAAHPTPVRPAYDIPTRIQPRSASMRLGTPQATPVTHGGRYRGDRHEQAETQRRQQAMSAPITDPLHPFYYGAGSSGHQASNNNACHNDHQPSGGYSPPSGGTSFSSDTSTTSTSCE